MISISIVNNEIVCDLKGATDFSHCLQVLKEGHCTYKPASHLWKVPAYKYLQILSSLQDTEVVSLSQDIETRLPFLLACRPELEISTERRLFHPELLKYPPFKGKPPNEEYQLIDILRAINRNRYGLFLDMGLGKAYIASAIITHLRYYGLAKKVLLISSNIGAANMVHELEKFSYIDPQEIFCLTRIKNGNRDIFFPDKQIIITNYNTFRLVYDHYYTKEHKKAPSKRSYAPLKALEDWLGDTPGILLLDESHALANPNSQQTQRILANVEAFNYRYLFTGTPADKQEKLYTQLKILDPSLTHRMSYSEWCQEYNETGNYYSSYAINPDRWKYDKLQELNTIVTKNYAVYRDAESHLELPENYIKKMFLPLEANHRQIYEAFVKQTLEDIKETKGSLKAHDVVNAFPYMQMALDFPAKLLLDHSDILTPELKEAIRHFSYEKDHIKFQVLQDILAEKVGELGEKGIIWIWHPATAELLKKALKNYSPLIITGETSTDEQERMAIVEKFKSDPQHKILIASIPVLNTSITITEASFQVYLERVYNYSQYTQSQARIHRIGQKKRVTTYILIADESIDCLLDANLDTKDAINSRILSKEFLTLDEWRRIFNMTEGDSYYKGTW